MDLRDVSEVDLPRFVDWSNTGGSKNGRVFNDAIPEAGKKEWLQLGGVWAFRWWVSGEGEHTEGSWTSWRVRAQEQSDQRFVNLQPVNVTMAMDEVKVRGWGAASRERWKEVKGLNPGKPQILKVWPALSVFQSAGYSEDSWIGHRCFSSLCQHDYKVSFRLASVVAKPLPVDFYQYHSQKIDCKLGKWFVLCKLIKDWYSLKICIIHSQISC